VAILFGTYLHYPRFLQQHILIERKDTMVKNISFVKRALLAFLVVTAAFTCMGMAEGVQVTHQVIKFKAIKQFVLEANSPYTMPAGEYTISEVSSLPGPGHLFSLDRVSDHKRVALLTTVRAVRNYSRHNRNSIVFNYEVSQLPVLEKFFVSRANGWQITGVEYSK
jgi:hypothetical protein